MTATGRAGPRQHVAPSARGCSGEPAPRPPAQPQLRKVPRRPTGSTGSRGARPSLGAALPMAVSQAAAVPTHSTTCGDRLAGELVHPLDGLLPALGDDVGRAQAGRRRPGASAGGRRHRDGGARRRAVGRRARRTGPLHRRRRPRPSRRAGAARSAPWWPVPITSVSVASAAASRSSERSASSGIAHERAVGERHPHGLPWPPSGARRQKPPACRGARAARGRSQVPSETATGDDALAPAQRPHLAGRRPRSRPRNSCPRARRRPYSAARRGRPRGRCRRCRRGSRAPRASDGLLERPRRRRPRPGCRPAAPPAQAPRPR